MKLEIALDSRDHAILVCDEDHNDIAEFYHSDHATVSQSYETALALAKQLVEGSRAPAQSTGEADNFAFAHEVYCNASRKDPVGCDGCSCRAGREIKRLRAALSTAQAAMVPAAWQYRVMFDARHERRDEWCPWHDAGEKYFNKVNAEIAAGATRVQTRILYALPSTERGVPEAWKKTWPDGGVTLSQFKPQELAGYTLTPLYALSRPESGTP